MKKLLLGTILVALAIVVPIPTLAGVDINIGISLPPPIAFQAPPEVIVIPDTNYVYAVPDIDFDLYFWNGWWWRLWQGRWYRSYYYNRGWSYYSSVPSFYYDVDPGWRGYYRSRNWYGHAWNYNRIPYNRLQNNWRTWNNNHYWERKGTWGVQNYQPRQQQQRQELRIQRQNQYHQRPEVQQYQKQQLPKQQYHPQGQQLPQQYQHQQQYQPQGQQLPKQYQPQQQYHPQGQQLEKQYQPKQNYQPQGQQLEKQYQHQEHQ